MSRALAVILTASSCLARLGSQEPVSAAPTAELLGTLDCTSPAAAHAIEDLDGDGRSEIVLLGATGTVEIWQWDAEARAFAARTDDPLVLPEPAFSVCAFADVLDGSEKELVVLSRRGVAAWRLDQRGVYAGEPVVLTTAGRLGVRVGEPRLADFLDDVDGDGRLDLVVPMGDACQLWLARDAARGDRGEGTRVPTFELTQTIPVDVERSQQRGGEALSSELRNRLRIPQLDIEDVNGDGRADLRVREGKVRTFYLQDEQGRFAERPIAVDLSIFRDTTPQATVEMGETLVLGDQQRMQSGDLNGDGIPDYVITHRRKVWSFLATEAGPQFTDAQTQIVAEDVSGVLLVHLDDDDREDLVVFKVQVPTVAALVLGVVSSIEIPITARGYPTGEGGVIAGRAQWQRELTLRTPSLLGLLGQAEELADRFADVLGRFRWSAQGDCDGDGIDDLVLLTEDDDAMELWRRPERAARPEREADRWFRELLFENPDTVFDVERLIKLAAQVFDARTSALTGERAADATQPLETREGRYLVGLVCADLDGDGRDEVLLVDDAEKTPGMLALRAWRWGAAPAGGR